MPSPLILPNRTRTLVQVARDWPTSDPGWTTLDAWCQTASRGANNDMGSATFYTPSSVLFKPGSAEGALVKSSSVCGKWCRVLRADDAGSVPSADGQLFSPLWHGIVVSRRIASDGIAFVNSYAATGILAALDAVMPQYHFCEEAGQVVAADIGAPLIFNYLGSKKTGNRSAEKYDFGRGVSAYVFSRNPGSSFWTALDVVEYWLALYSYFSQVGPLFSFGEGSQLDALSWVEKWDMNGHTCGEAVSRVMSQKQGIGYSCKVPNGETQPVITVKSLARTAITVPATPFVPAFTLPASDAQVTVDMTGEGSIQQFELQEDSTATVDELTVSTTKAWYVATFSLFDDFDDDWKPEDLAAWEELDPLATYGTLNTNFGIARVFRRFKLKADWAGTLAGGFVVPNARAKENSALHGSGGLNGATINDPAATRPIGPTFTLTADLPCLDGYDWSTVDPSTVDKTRRNASAMAFMENGDGTWSTLAESSSGGMTSISIEVDGDLGAITFPEEVARTLQIARDEGLKVYVTVGLHGQLDDAVSWRRAEAQRTRDQVRSVTKPRPALTRKIIPAGAVVGVSPDGSLLTVASEIVVHDDTALADSVLAVSRPWFTQNGWGMTFGKTGEIDPDYIEPCTMVTSMRHFEGDGSVTDEEVFGVVTGVTWKFAEPGETSATTKRIPIDVEPVI